MAIVKASSFATIKINILGVTTVLATEIEYKSMQEKENLRGAGAEVQMRGYGAVNYDASITMYRDEAMKIQKALGNKELIAAPPFTILVVDTNSKVTDTLSDVEFLEDARSWKLDDKASLITFPLIVGKISTL